MAYYAREAGGDVAARFIDAVVRARQHLATYPSSGSLRFAHETGIEELRSWPLRGFPNLMIYIDRETHADILRVLHAHREIPATLASAPSA